VRGENPGLILGISWYGFHEIENLHAAHNPPEHAVSVVQVMCWLEQNEAARHHERPQSCEQQWSEGSP
jgi:hypothetical protein